MGFWTLVNVPNPYFGHKLVLAIFHAESIYARKRAFLRQSFFFLQFFSVFDMVFWGTMIPWDLGYCVSAVHGLCTCTIFRGKYKAREFGDPRWLGSCLCRLAVQGKLVRTKQKDT